MADQQITFNFRGAGGQLVSETKKIEQELRDLEAQSKVFGTASAKAGADASGAARGAAKAYDEQASSFERLTGAIASGAVVAKINEIGQATLATGLKFEALQSTLENTLGSKSAAEQVFGRLQTFAADTPNQLDEVVQAFISLKQRGIEPTNDVLRKFGDIASSQGKPLQQFIEAVLDATTGENERLKEFGIQAQAAGNKVSFTFQGITKTVDKTPEAINGALLAFGALEGVAGGMEKKAATLGGQFSNLTDNTEALQNELFGLAQGPMIAVVTQANALINYFRDLPAPIQLTVLGIAGVSGALIAATAAITAFNLANGQAIVTTTLESAALVKDAIATNAVAGAKLIAAAATGTLTEAQLAGVSAMAATAVTAGLVVGALASIALAVDTFNKVTEAAKETDKATANIEKSLASLIEVEKKYADAAGKTAANQSLEAAALERTQKQLGPIQNALDVLRSLLNTLSLRNLLTEFAKLEVVPESVKNLINALAGLLPKVSTAAEESLREQAVSFEEQATKADELTGKVFELFTKGAGKLSDNELKLYKSAVDEATEAIKAHIPIDAQDAGIKAARLPLLEKSKKLIDAETAAREKNKIATEAGAAVATLEQKNNRAALEQALKIALLKSNQADGVVSARDSQAQLTQIEQEGLQKRLENTKSAIAQNAKLTEAAKTYDKQKPLLDEAIKLQTDAATLEGQIADKRRDRQKQQQANQLKDLETYQAKAADAIQASETALQIQDENDYQKDLTQKQRYELLKLATTQDRIKAEIEAEQERTKTLQNLTFSDPDEYEANQAKIRASQQKTASLTLKQLENQRAIEQAIAEYRIKQINDAAAAEKRAYTNRKLAYESEKNDLENVTNSLERQNKLREAGTNLLKAQAALTETGASIETAALDRALELRKKLNDETTSPAVRRVLQQQLEALTGRRDTNEVTILQRKFAIEDAIAKLKAISLLKEQDAARQALAVESQRNELAAQRAVIEARIAEINAKTALSEAKKNLADLQQTPGADPSAIADAAQAVKEAQQNVGAATGNVKNAQENLQEQKPLAALAERTLAAQQLQALAQQQAAEYARQQAEQLTIVEAKSKAIAGGDQRVRFTADDFRKIEAPKLNLGAENERIIRRALPVNAPLPIPAGITVPSYKPSALESGSAQLKELIDLAREQVTLGQATNVGLNAIATRKPTVIIPVAPPQSSKPQEVSFAGLPI